MSNPIPVARPESDIPSTARFCVNCRFFIADGLRCDAPQSWTTEVAINLVTGERRREQRIKFCDTQRENPSRGEYDNCGIEGMWFEPRQTAEAE